MDGARAARRAVTEGLFRFDEGGVTLLCSRCAGCEVDFFPRSDICPYCGAGLVEDVTRDGTGAALWAWTGVNAAPPGYGGPVPYGFGVVEMPGGMRLVTRITEPDPDRLEAGMEMHLTLDVVGEDEDGTEVVSWAFAPGEGPA